MDGPAIPSFDLLDDIDFGGLKVATMRAALELDVFTCVAHGATDVASLAAAMQCSERGVRVLVRALLSLGALEGSPAALRNSATTGAYLVRGAPGDTRSIFLSWMQNRDRLTDAVRTGEGPGRHDVDEATDDWQAYASPDLVRWPELVPAVQQAFTERGLSVREGAHIVDLGCGSGLVGFAVGTMADGTTVTSVDRAEVLATTRALAAAMGLVGRVRFRPGDVSEVELEAESADLVLLVNVAQYLDDDRLAKALANMWRALRVGGVGYVASVVVDDGTPGNQMNWASGVEMFLASGIDQRDVGTMEALLRAAGFSDVRHIPPNRFVLTK